MAVSDEEVVAAFKGHCTAEFGGCDYPACECDWNGAPFEDGVRYMRAALEAAEKVRLKQWGWKDKAPALSAQETEEGRPND